MKHFLIVVICCAFGASSFADIQDPPGNDYGPTRKLGRGVSNLFFAPAEIFVSTAKVNTDEGNSAAAGYGVVRGLGRSATRHVVGLIEILTFPFPTWHESYYPMLPSEIPYIHAGYAEFPPELGNESRYDYVRDY
jgi:putative exosortase-associated protein (TIGR04073 family)